MKFLLSVLASLSLTAMSQSTVAAPGIDGAPFALVIHGGAGVISKEEMTPEMEKAQLTALTESLRTGHAILKTNGTSLDAVIAAIKVLEDSPLFNAGRGAVLNSDGVVELDAAIMDGATRKAGAVAAVKHVRNPIEAARLVMDKTRHVMLVGEGADLFAKGQGTELVSQDYFITEYRKKQLERIQNEQKQTPKPHSNRQQGRTTDLVGTVGAVALDRQGNLAAGTSTGGIVNKQPGRVGDSPIIGAGTYANNATCAISATGQGEYFIRAVVAHDISALIEYKGMTLKEAAELVVKKELVEFGGEGGVIGIDGKGNISMPFNSLGMYRGHVREDGKPFVAVY
jgi:beta-aspartyl-peptidase (threonine type)